MSDPGKGVRKWADDAMFASESHDATKGPVVHLLHMNADPLGSIAACAKMYMGQVVRDLTDVTDDERKRFLADMQKTKLAMPLEAVTFHFMLENVTRGFTHQLVRQRTAAYAQESMRFAVVEDMNDAVALPPSLACFNEPGVGDTAWEAYRYHGEDGVPRDAAGRKDYLDRIKQSDTKWYLKWRETVEAITNGYSFLVNDGMPQEDARGLMPTNIITRVNYITNLRGLLDHAGNRLCTQAQFEWRLVFAQIAKAIRSYNNQLNYDGEPLAPWQFEALADLLKPVCYQRNSCPMQASFDRKCSIRARVDANADLNRPSTEWGQELDNVQDNPVFAGMGPQNVVRETTGGQNTPVFIGAIQPAEWLLNPAAAR